MELTEGTKLGIFTIIRQIGAGGMSEVYLVKDNLDRLFALKTISTRLSHDPSFRQRFEQEARIMATLSHPNIVQLHSYFEEEGNFCLVMEYIEGGSLKDLTRRIGPIPEKRALKILRQIAEALSYAHGKGIIHRDIKPSNILLDANDNVKVMDFGIARMTEGPGITMTGTQMGTLTYMSPEQIQDSKYVDHKTDIYSLGVSFYEMLTGKPPYNESDSNDFEIRESIVYKELPDPRKVYPHIGEHSMRLLDGFTRKNKEERLSLSEFLAGQQPNTLGFSESQEATIEEISNHEAENPSQRKASSLGKIMALVVVLGILVVVAGIMFRKNKQKIGITPEMILVEGGTFMMGSRDGESDEKPIHEVTVSSFWIGKYEVTQNEWMEVMGDNPSEWKGENLPVENISWLDAVGYCNERSIREGLTPCYSGSGDNIICNWSANGYRLPTEAEWEYAARGGLKSKGYKYSGSDNSNTVAWHSGNSGRRTHEVGGRNPNELGIYDMSGNVWAWCWDWHDDSYYSVSSSLDPRGPGIGSSRVFRGGSWYGIAGLCAVSNRGFIEPTYSHGNLGLRICRSSL